MADETTPDQIQLGETQLVDVRTREERDAGHIPADTAHIPFDELLSRAGELDRARPVVFYCLSGDRSGSAADAFAASGFQAASLKGGIVGWQESGREIEGEIRHPSGLPPR